LAVVGRRRLAVLCAATVAVTAPHGLRYFWPLGYAASWMALAVALVVTAVSAGSSGRRCSLVLAAVPVVGLVAALPAAQWSLLPPVGPDLAFAALLAVALVVVALLDTAVQHRRPRPAPAQPADAPHVMVDPS
jgi:hypothetical protein